MREGEGGGRGRRGGGRRGRGGREGGGGVGGLSAVKLGFNLSHNFFNA